MDAFCMHNCLSYAAKSLGQVHLATSQRPLQGLLSYRNRNDLIETRMTASVLKTSSKHIKGSKERYLLGQKHNIQIFGVIPFVKLQNDT